MDNFFNFVKFDLPYLMGQLVCQTSFEATPLKLTELLGSIIFINSMGDMWHPYLESPWCVNMRSEVVYILESSKRL